MNITELKKSLQYLFKAQHTPFIWGHAGIGKSTVVKQYAEEKGYKYFPFYLGTQSDIGDILGLASFVKDENGSEVATTFATPLWLKETIEYCNENPDSGAIIFLDEFNRARRDILQGMFSLALDKTFHTIKLPPNCYIIAAGNPPTEEYQVTDVDETALMARFTHVKLEPTYSEWAEYARNAKFESTLLTFLDGQPELLEDAKTDFRLPVKVDRRAYERLNRLFKIETPFEIIEKLAVGIIGIERLVAYKQHLTKSDHPLTSHEVLAGKKLDVIQKWSDPKDIKSSLLSKTCDNVFSEFVKLATLADIEANNFMVFVETIPKDLAYALLKNLLTSAPPVFMSFIRNDLYKTRLEVLAEEATGRKAK